MEQCFIPRLVLFCFFVWFVCMPCSTHITRGGGGSFYISGVIVPLQALTLTLKDIL